MSNLLKLVSLKTTFFSPCLFSSQDPSITPFFSVPFHHFKALVLCPCLQCLKLQPLPLPHHLQLRAGPAPSFLPVGLAAGFCAGAVASYPHFSGQMRETQSARTEAEGRWPL